MYLWYWLSWQIYESSRTSHATEIKKLQILSCLAPLSHHDASWVDSCELNEEVISQKCCTVCISMYIKGHVILLYCTLYNAEKAYKFTKFRDSNYVLRLWKRQNRLYGLYKSLWIYWLSTQQSHLNLFFTFPIFYDSEGRDHPTEQYLWGTWQVSAVLGPYHGWSVPFWRVGSTKYDLLFN